MTGETARLEASSPGFSKWLSENSLVMSWLINSMKPVISRNYLFYKSAKDIWSIVKEMYSDLENSAQLFEIKSVVKECRQGEKSVIEYYHTLTGLW